MLFSRHAFTSSTAIAASSALFASTFIAAATSKASSSAASAKNEAGNVDAGILALSPSSSHVGENRLQGIFGEERALQGLCSAGYVNCYKGYLDNDNTRKCIDACYNASAPTFYDCCDGGGGANGNDACKYFTGKICRDGSCYGPSACRSATIPLVVDSCKGERACDHVAYINVTAGDPAATVGNFISSCKAQMACSGIAKYGGSAGNIVNSCNAYRACADSGQKDAIGNVTSDLKNCCNSYKACYKLYEAIVPAECKATEAPTPEPTEAPTPEPTEAPTPLSTPAPTPLSTPAPTPLSTTLGPKAGKNKKAGKASKPTPAPTVSAAPTDSAAPSNAKSGKNKKGKTASLFE